MGYGRGMAARRVTLICMVCLMRLLLWEWHLGLVAFSEQKRPRVKPRLGLGLGCLY